MESKRMVSLEYSTRIKQFQAMTFPIHAFGYFRADWLTPLHLKTKSRFDTIFYIACVDSSIDQSTASEVRNYHFCILYLTH